jgi:pimeloyl-ACP methyl ester carboxylesterase
LLAPIGITRLSGACFDDNDAPIANCARYFDTACTEYASVVTSAHQVRDAYGKSLHPEPGSRPPFGATPLIVLTRDPSWGDYDPENLKAAWQVLQKELTRLSSNSRQEIAKGSGHYIHLSQPKLVTSAIRDVVLAATSGQLLSGSVPNGLVEGPH